MISDMFLQELKGYSDLEQLISSYVNLKRRGRILSGLCPFHSEKSPSFTVYPENQSFFCFGCGAGGDVITFVRRIENLEYIEAVRFLAQRAGMAMPEDSENDGMARLKTRVLEVNRTLARFYHACLKEPRGEAALEYLHGRGLGNKTITRFGIGYAPDGWDAALKFLKGNGFAEEEIIAATVATRGKNGGMYDQFRNRVIFPIIDLRGNVIGFGGRIMGDARGPKYLNSSDTPVFKKSRNLFALNFAKSSKRDGLILCEGYMDVIAMHQAGFDNAVATLGTALTGEQSRLVAQYAQSVTLSYDSDEPGQAATRRAVALLGEVGVKIKVLAITGAKDPDEFIKKYGAERFALLLEGSSNATEFEIARLKKRFDVETEDGKLAFMREFVKLMLTIPNEIERDVYISKTAHELEVSKDAIAAQLTHEKKRAQKKKKRDINELKVYSEVGVGARQDPQRTRNMKCALAEDKLLGILIKNPDYFQHISSRLAIADYVTDRNRELAEVLYRRLENGQSIDFTLLGAELSIDQMSVIAELTSAVSGLMFGASDADSYIDVILSHKTEKTGDEVAGMSDEDMRAYIASLASKKK